MSLLSHFGDSGQCLGSVMCSYAYKKQDIYFATGRCNYFISASAFLVVALCCTLCVSFMYVRSNESRHGGVVVILSSIIY